MSGITTFVLSVITSFFCVEFLFLCSWSIFPLIVTSGVSRFIEIGSGFSPGHVAKFTFLIDLIKVCCAGLKHAVWKYSSTCIFVLFGVFITPFANCCSRNIFHKPLDLRLLPINMIEYFSRMVIFYFEKLSVCHVSHNCPTDTKA